MCIIFVLLWISVLLTSTRVSREEKLFLSRFTDCFPVERLQGHRCKSHAKNRRRLQEPSRTEAESVREAKREYPDVINAHSVYLIDR